MNRRDAIARVALLMGGTVLGAEYFLSGCTSPSDKSAEKKTKKSENFLSRNQIDLLNEVGETILPTTQTPGAKAADVGSFMAIMVRDCYTPDDQKVFKAGLEQLNQDCKQLHGKEFTACTPEQRTAFLTQLDKQQKDFKANRRKDDPSRYFRMMKELTLLGYFTSEVGSTKALRYVPVPGRYDGCVPYKKGDKAWATT